MKNTNLINKLSKLTDDLKVFKKAIQFEYGAETFKSLGPISFFNHVISIGKKNMSIQRFKGLGEMNPDELWDTTLNPNENNLLQVNYSDRNGEITTPSNADDEIFNTLMGDDVSKRKVFINENAINVVNLDI